MNEKQKKITMTAIITSIIIIIAGISIINHEDPNEKLMNCISSNSHLFVSKTCGHCANQKQILGEHLIKFNITDCTENQQECINKGITAVPTWIINNEKHTGVNSIDKLKELTRC